MSQTISKLQDMAEAQASAIEAARWMVHRYEKLPDSHSDCFGASCEHELPSRARWLERRKQTALTILDHMEKGNLIFADRETYDMISRAMASADALAVIEEGDFSQDGELQKSGIMADRFDRSDPTNDIFTVFTNDQRIKTMEKQRLERMEKQQLEILEKQQRDRLRLPKLCPARDEAFMTKLRSVKADANAIIQALEKQLEHKTQEHENELKTKDKAIENAKQVSSNAVALVSDLEAQLHQSNVKVDDLRAKINCLYLHSNSLKDAMNRAIAHEKSLDDQINNLKREKRLFEERIALETTNAAKLKAGHDDLAARYRDLESKMDSIKLSERNMFAHVDTLISDKKTLQQQIDALTQDNKGLHWSVDRHRAMLETVQKEKQDLEDQIKADKAHRKILEVDLESAEKKVEMHDADKAKLLKENKEWSDRLAKLEAEYTGRIQELGNTVSSQAASLAESRENTTALRAELGKAKEQIDTLAAKNRHLSSYQTGYFADLNAKYAATLDENKALSSQVYSLSQNWSSVTAKLNHLVSEEEAKARNIKELADKCKELVDENAKLVGTNQELTANNVNLAEANEALTQKNDSLNTQCNFLIDEKENLEWLIEEQEQLHAQIGEMDREISALTARNTELEDEKYRLEGQVAELLENKKNLTQEKDKLAATKVRLSTERNKFFMENMKLMRGSSIMGADMIKLTSRLHEMSTKHSRASKEVQKALLAAEGYKKELEDMLQEQREIVAHCDKLEEENERLVEVAAGYDVLSLKDELEQAEDFADLEEEESEQTDYKTANNEETPDGEENFEYEENFEEDFDENLDEDFEDEENYYEDYDEDYDEDFEEDFTNEENYEHFDGQENYDHFDGEENYEEDNEEDFTNEENHDGLSYDEEHVDHSAEPDVDEGAARPGVASVEEAETGAEDLDSF